MKDWLSTMHDVQRTILDSAYEIEDVADRLEYVFPQSPAVEALRYVAKALRLQHEALNEATWGAVQGGLKQAEEQSGLLLKATLAGLVMSGKYDDKPEQREQLTKIVDHE